MKHYLAAAVAVAALSTPSFAQSEAAPAAVAATPAPAPAPVVAVARPSADANSLLPANTEVLLRLNSEVNSKKARKGDHFDLTVANDVMLGNYIVIPRGTPARGEITYRTGKGAFGKSAKMEYSITSLDLNGQSIPLQGHFRQEGNGNTGATVATAIAVGVFSAFVTGKSAVVPAGTELKVYTRMPLPVLPPVAGAAASK